ncbi:MAG: alanine--tRNA ligase, partial [Planctomycetota bacterium]
MTAQDQTSHDQSEPTRRPRFRRAADIRRAFIEYFAAKPSPSDGHPIVASSPVVPIGDPTLLFTNAGMNQFKPCFLGQVEPGSPLEGLARATNSQKCIRAGGKHNDLEDVGKDTYHHTFFEMLGNWSFGDYFKAEAIEWAWHFLTGPESEGCMALDPSRFYATYFGGDKSAGLAPDLEARDLWLRHLPPQRVLPGSFKDNFWEMGDTGPCGPCSELHYDRIGDRDAAALVNQDDPDVLEIWNLVFIQYDRQADATLLDLPAKHVDTGMGLERLVSVMQNVRSNYDTDLFLPIFDAIERAARAPRSYRGKLGKDDKDQIDMAYGVIADHIRALSFAIADGATPSNEGAGYVLRRILRRAVRFGRQMMDAPPGFFAALVPTVVDMMGDAFPELRTKAEHIRSVIADEEDSFGKTLDRGIKLFDEVAASGSITGPDAFKLYDTFGFPIDLTQLMAAERGIGVDIAGFEAEMAKQKERSRAGAKSTAGSSIALTTDAVDKLKKLNIRPTDDSHKHAGRTTSAKVVAIWDNKNFDEHANIGTGTVGIILDKTSCYAEAGGQVGDKAKLDVTHERKIGNDHGGGSFRVQDTQAFGGYVLHIGLVARGEIRVGDVVAIKPDNAHRQPAQANHTATHLLNKALRDVLGDHVDQKGSLVAPDRLRFDFAHNKPVTDAELADIEQRVRTIISDKQVVTASIAPLYVAQGITGLRAVFGEKYPDPVRVVCIGADVQDVIADPENERWADCSIEFCGGTHLATTDEAEAFAITSETGIAKGVRRIEALTGKPALAAMAAAHAFAERIAKAQSLSATELTTEAKAIATDMDAETLSAASRAQLKGQLATLNDKLKDAAKAVAAETRARVEGEARVIAQNAAGSPNAFIVSRVSAGSDRQALQAACKLIRDKLPKHAVLLASADETDPAKPQVAIIAQAPKDLIARGIKAGDWVRVTAEAVGGKGGGKPD